MPDCSQQTCRGSLEDVAVRSLLNRPPQLKGLKEVSKPLGKIGNSGSMPVTAAGQMLAGLV
ncbi:TPA: hypothetical protein ACH3X3_002638 [Trebouxia sp. C0006]